MFSLNVTGCYVGDFFFGVGGIRYHLYSYSLGKDLLEVIRHLINKNEKIFAHFIAEKKLNIFRIIILYRGYSTKFQGMGAYMTSNPHSVKWKFQGGGRGVSKVKVPSVGSMDIFSGTTQQ